MRYLSFVFLFILSINTAAQSPAVSRLFSDGTNQARASNFADALKSYKTALHLSENEYAGAVYRSKLHYNIGVCYFRLERLDEAAKHLKQSILLNSAYTRAHYALGMVEMHGRKWKAAAATFRKLLELDPKNGEAWFDLAFASIALNDLTTAERAFVRSIEFASIDAALSHNNIGVILAMRGELDAAEAQFGNAITMSSGRLIEARHNLEFCRARRLGSKELIASEILFARRTPVLAG